MVDAVREDLLRLHAALMLFNHYIFDVDGTLVDSGGGIIYARTAALNSVGIDTDPSKLKEVAFGPSMREILATLIPNEEKRSYAETTFRSAYDTTGILLSQVHPGIEDLLFRIRHAGGTISFLSANNKVVISRLLRMHRLMNPNELVMTSQGLTSHLSKAELLKQHVHQIGTVSGVVVIGDTEADFHAAEVTGVKFVGAGYGFRGVQFLRDVGARVVADSPSHLTRLLFG